MISPKSSQTPMPFWGDALRTGDVVLFVFPCAEAEPTEKPKSRTCLVLNVEMRGDRRFVELAYGTASNTDANVGDEIHVYRPSDMEAAGVKKPTRFVCARRITVPLDHHGWDINDKHPSPVVGHLPQRLLNRMNAIRSRFAAFRNHGCNAPRTKTPNFAVEHRRPRRLQKHHPEVRA